MRGDSNERQQFTGPLEDATITMLLKPFWTFMSADIPKPSHGEDTPTASGRDRRRDPRYLLVADARVTEVASNSEFKVRVSDLSISGCYLDFSTPLPEGTDVIVRISRDNGVFETGAKVVFVLPHMGMGVRFVDTKPTQQAILSRWIMALAALENSGS
jgi:hypothetical protein